MDFPQTFITPTHLCAWSFQSVGPKIHALTASGAGNPSTNAWPVANTAIYVPLWLPWPYLVRRVFVGNGSSAGSNFDVGVYSEDGACVFTSGSQAGSGASALQFFSLATPELLSPGSYYMAMSANNTTVNRYLIWTTVTALELRFAGVLEQTSAFALPTTSATFAQRSQVGLPLFGISRMASGI